MHFVDLVEKLDRIRLNRVVMSILLMIVLSGAIDRDISRAAAESISKDNLQHQLEVLLSQKQERASDPEFLVRLADLYLDLGDDDSLPKSKRKDAYQEGARVAHRAIELREPNAQAHYLYAANLGNVTQLQGLMASALIIQDLKRHVMRALELNPHHAQASHMMGMMLEELPWFLGGDAEGAITYMRRAVVSDPKDCHARLDLAKAYIKRKDRNSARQELETILQQPLAPDASLSDRRHREEAGQLWDSLKTS